MPSGLTRGIMLKGKNLELDPIQSNWIKVEAQWPCCCDCAAPAPIAWLFRDVI